MDATMTLRPADANDAHTLFTWRNLPELIRLSSTRQTVGWDEHAAWFAAHVASEDCRLFIVEQAGSAIGQVRLDHQGAGQWLISAYLLPGRTGQGIGSKAIAAAVERLCGEHGDALVIAHIRHDNQRSLAAFRRAAFGPAGMEVVAKPDHVVLTRHCHAGIT